MSGKTSQVVLAKVQELAEGQVELKKVIIAQNSTILEMLETIQERLANVEKKRTALGVRLEELEDTRNTIVQNREGYFPVIRYIQGGI